MPDIECMDLTTKPLTEAPALERVPERSGSADVWRGAYVQRTKHRRRCPACSRLIADGEAFAAPLAERQNIARYSGQPYTKRSRVFFHAECYDAREVR